MNSSAKFGAITTSTSPPVSDNLVCDNSANDDALNEIVTSLFNQYSGPISAYIHVLVKDWQLAQELTQEAYLRLYRTRIRLPDVENQRAWIYRIAHNVAMTELKRRGRFAWLPWRATDDEPNFRWVDTTRAVDERADIEETLRLLPEHYRAPLILYSSHGLSVKEVAETLELTESAVKVRLHRAREMFRKLHTQEHLK